MIEIRPLVQLDWAMLAQAIVGYESNAKYAVSKQETLGLTTIEVRLTRLEQPYVKRFDPLEDSMSRLYQSAVASGFSLAAFDGGQLAGLALAEPQWWNRSLWVWEFHVVAAFRRRGLGRQLMEALAGKGREAGLRTLVCETQNTNAPAIEFYRSVGFNLEGIDLSYYTNDDVESGEVAFFMKRRLS